jgi:hypothetical protein
MGARLPLFRGFAVRCDGFAAYAADGFAQ